MHITEITAKQFLNTMKNPDLSRRIEILAKVKAALAKHGFEMTKVRRKLKTKYGEIYFQVPGITTEKQFKKAKTAIAMVLDKNAIIVQSWYLGNDYQTPLGYASFFVYPNVQEKDPI